LCAIGRAAHRGAGKQLVEELVRLLIDGDALRRRSGAWFLLTLEPVGHNPACIIRRAAALGRNQVAEREGPNPVLLSKYLARNVLAIAVLRPSFAAKRDYLALGSVAIVHCSLQLRDCARIAPKHVMYAYFLSRSAPAPDCGSWS
jgi:hypothetical protein